MFIYLGQWPEVQEAKFLVFCLIAMFCHGCLFADRNSQMLPVSEIITIFILGQLFSVCLLIEGYEVKLLYCSV